LFAYRSSINTDSPSLRNHFVPQIRFIIQHTYEYQTVKLILLRKRRKSTILYIQYVV